MKTLFKSIVVLFTFIIIASSSVLAQDVRVNVYFDDQSGGTPPFTYVVKITVSDTSLYYGISEDGADSDPVPVTIVNYGPEHLPGSYFVSVEKWDSNYQIVGMGNDSGTLTTNGQYIEVELY